MVGWSKPTPRKISALLLGARGIGAKNVPQRAESQEVQCRAALAFRSHVSAALTADLFGNNPATKQLRLQSRKFRARLVRAEAWLPRLAKVAHRLL
jgi:hypothetical protein